MSLPAALTILVLLAGLPAMVWAAKRDCERMRRGER